MRLLAQTVFTVSITDKERLCANQSAEILTEAQHSVPLRMNPNFSDAAFHIRSIPVLLLISAADVNSFSSPEPLGSQGELIVYPSSRRPSVRLRSSVHHFQRSYVEPPWEGGTKVCINGPGHMTKMATTPIYGKNPSQFFFSRTGGSISTKLGM